MGIQHYQGLPGAEYFRTHFPDGVERGLAYQARYFQSHSTGADVVLDFGCGQGGILRNVPARKRIGVEVNEAARAECRRLCEQQGIGIELHPNLESVAPGSVDVVISNHCLEHVVDPLRTAEKLFALLRPSGILVVVTPFDDWRNYCNHRWHRNDTDHHLYTWSPMNLGNLLSEAGFQVESVAIHARAWSPKLFWIWTWMGLAAFDCACSLLGVLKDRREVVAKARKPRCLPES